MGPRIILSARALPLFLLLVVNSASAVDQLSITVAPENGRLQYHGDERGDLIPDFSWAGFRGGGVALPQAPVRLTLEPSDSGDDGARIQAALDQVAAGSADATGVRGAVLLRRGSYRIAGSVKVSPGVVLRGEGQDAGQTELIAVGTKPREVIVIDGRCVRSEIAGSRRRITDTRVPVGCHRLTVEDPENFTVGDEVVIHRPSTTEWIHAIGMDRIVPRSSDPSSTKQWKAGDYDLDFPCTVTGVDAAGVVVDVPVVMAFAADYGGGTLARSAHMPATMAGVESLRVSSEYAVGKETEDEEHATYAIAITKALDCWVRDVTALHFVGGCVDVHAGTRRITVQDCACLDGVSQITGGRRYSFSVGGQQVLVQRCYARNGRHDVVTGARVPGPDVFLDCLAEICHADSGPHHRWAVGILYDGITCSELNVQDRGSLGSGHGWAGAYNVLWNCNASIVCEAPPQAQNWAIGCIGSRGRARFERPSGRFESWGQPVAPRSLYLQQLEDRLGIAALQAISIAEQRSGAITMVLRQRFAGEPAYGGRQVKAKSGTDEP
jgi:hypothetical protein